jgi:hypothetical protein
VTEFEQFKANAVEIANAHTVAMKDLNEREVMGYVRGIVADNDVVVAVWQDKAEPHGVGLLVVKGANMIREVVASAITATGVKVSAVTCCDYAQAVALWRALGDKPDAQ